MLSFTNSPLTRPAITTTVIAYTDCLVATRTVRQGDKTPSWSIVGSGGKHFFTYNSRKEMLAALAAK